MKNYIVSRCKDKNKKREKFAWMDLPLKNTHNHFLAFRVKHAYTYTSLDIDSMIVPWTMEFYRFWRASK